MINGSSHGAGRLRLTCARGLTVATKEIVGEWLTGEYGSKIEEFAAERGVPRARVDRTFREHCETFRRQVAEGTPPDVVRRLAFDRLIRHSPGGNGGTGTDD